MANIKIGSNNWSNLAKAFLWWLGLPEGVSAAGVPKRNLNEFLLECARQRGADSPTSRESSGYVIACGNDAGWLTLRSVAGKAGVSVTPMA